MAYLREISPPMCSCGRRAIKELRAWNNAPIRELCAHCAKAALRHQEDIENRALAELKKESA